MDSSSQALWYVTFGAQYSHLMHPWCPVISPDSVVKLVAPDYDMARELTVRLFGQQWSNLEEWDAATIEEFYPAGVAFTVRLGAAAGVPAGVAAAPPPEARIWRSLPTVSDAWAPRPSQ